LDFAGCPSATAGIYVGKGFLQWLWSLRVLHRHHGGRSFMHDPGTDCDGAVIETAEGIADAKHPLVEAYIMNWTAQCGYCTPGFLVTAKALLDRIPNPTVEDIKEALAGNLCRCGTYPAHIKAIQDAANVLKGEE
jgi:hypothetical protein